MSAPRDPIHRITLRPGTPRSSVRAAAYCFVLALVLAVSVSGQEDGYRMTIRQGGVHRVPYESVEPARLWSVASEWVSVRWRDEDVAVWVDDGGDGFFGPGDAIEFVGRHLRGETTHYHPETRENIYWLHLDRPNLEPMQTAKVAPANREEAEVPWVPTFRYHVEREETKVRFAGRQHETTPDEWYWAKITPIDQEPLKVALDLRRWQRDAGSVKLSVAFQGWSKPRRRGKDSPSDHQVQVWLDEVLLGEAEWDGAEAFVLKLKELGPEALGSDLPELELRVPRRHDAEGEPWIDVVLLDWFEVEFPVAPLAWESHPVYFEADGRTGYEIDGGGEPMTVYSSDGRRVVLSPGEDRTAHYVPEAGETWAYSVTPGRHLKVERVQADQPSRLLGSEVQVDYLMISHARLIGSLEPLAQFHRSRGLTVEIVDVQDIYDEFNNGILSAESIQRFIADAYHHRPAPAPRFVLLAGDASWDPRGVGTAEDQDYSDWTFRGNERRPFVKNQSTAYSESVEDRNLVPSRAYQSYEGHAAADNWYVAVEGDDIHPDLAIGRFPVATPEEVEAIVAKTIRYVEEAEVGPWRRQVLWITNEQKGMQRSSDLLASSMADRGFADLKVYPLPEEEDNSKHQAVLKDAFSSGNLLVHFLGHGGRYIWRTGPPDFSKNHDLFTLDDLDDLEPTDNLPIILSMTCYSAPFDHPTADSIGEKFLRLADRGAVAVLAASWRNSPGRQFSQALLDELTGPGATIGEAVQRAKGAIRSEVLIETYNLLGDPAVPIPLPSMPIDVGWSRSTGSLALEVDAGDLTGEVLVEWLGAEDTIVLSQQQSIAGEPLSLVFAGSDGLGEEPVGARVYVWDVESRRDGLAQVEFESDSDETDGSKATGR